jgi:DNA topoisomerase IB
MISTGRFFEFVKEFVKTHNEEQEDKTIWEFWLHKVFDKSLEEFKESIKKTNTAAPTQKELKETVQATFDMLDGFSLRGGAQDGDIQAAGDSSD